MGNRLVVSNLHGSMNNLRLEQLFARHGRVSSAQIVLNNGHVQMRSDEEADRAMAALNGFIIDGQTISVGHAPPSGQEEETATTQPRRQPKYGNGRSGGGGVRSGRRF
jgi:RNA recognition motif-containing protein